MTEKERVEAVLRRGKPDRVPLWTFFDLTGFSAVYHNRPIGDAYRDPEVSLAYGKLHGTLVALGFSVVPCLNDYF